MNEIIVLHLLADGRLVVFQGGRRTIFKQLIEATIFLQLIVNQLQALTEDHHEPNAAHPFRPHGPAATVAEAHDHPY